MTSNRQWEEFMAMKERNDAAYAAPAAGPQPQEADPDPATTACCSPAATHERTTPMTDRPGLPAEYDTEPEPSPRPVPPQATEATAALLLDMDAVARIDAWLDASVDPLYREQPMAQDWARVAKVTEEAGEAIDALIGCTGQNPRKGYYSTTEDLLNELADVAMTGMLAIQHFTKDKARTARILSDRLARTEKRVTS